MMTCFSFYTSIQNGSLDQEVQWIFFEAKDQAFLYSSFD